MNNNRNSAGAGVDRDNLTNGENSAGTTRDKSVKTEKRIDIIAKIVCFLGAFILWFYAMQVDSPDYQQVFSLVPVTATGADVIGNQYGLSVYSGIDNPIEVTIKGKKSDISKIKIEDIIATVDLSQITEAGEYKIDINVSLPSHLTVEGIFPNVLNVYVDERVSATIPIKTKITSMVIEAPNQTGDPVIENPEVTIAGPKKLVDDISHAQVDLNVGKISASIDMISKILLVKKNGDIISTIPSNLKLSRTEVSVKIPVYTYKTIPLAVGFKYGYFNSSNASITISPQSVKVKGDPVVLNKYDSLIITTLDEKKITSDEETKLVTIDLPEGIEITDGVSSASIDIKLKNTVTREFKYSRGRIRVINAANIDYEILTDILTLKFRGSESDIDSLKTADITVTLDLSGYSDISGIISEPVTITFSDNVGKTIYELGDYIVSIQIK